MELRELLTQVFAGSLSAQIELISAFQDCGYNIKLIKIEEEPEMLNFDKYVNEIVEERKNHTALDCALLKIRIRHGAGKSCANTPCSECREDSINWLCEEYKPQFLKNGDGLKPGDWIMVRDEDDQIWKKERFLSFANGSFYCIKSLFGSHDGKTNRDLYGEFVCYRQARLPGDGE